MEIRCLHVVTGDRPMAQAVRQWQVQHACQTLEFADAYDACVALLRQPEYTASIAFLGVDWLPRDDVPIVDYIRMTWPHVVQIGYGQQPQSLGAAQETLRVYDAVGLRRLLSLPPLDLIRMQRERRTRIYSADSDLDWVAASQLEGGLGSTWSDVALADARTAVSPRSQQARRDQRRRRGDGD